MPSGDMTPNEHFVRVLCVYCACVCACVCECVRGTLDPCDARGCNPIRNVVSAL